MSLDRLARCYRHNSSLPGAIIGKIARKLLDASNAARVRRYNASVAQFSLPRSGSAPKLFAVCFTCGKHFEFVKFALLSLAKTNATIAEIVIFMDRDGPLSSKQQDVLRRIAHSSISFLETTYPMRGWGGPKVILSEANAYRVIAGKMSNDDFLMKFDSDVIFVNETIIQRVIRGKAAAVGTCAGTFHRTFRDDENHMQGGCYFIRGAELAKILSMPMPASIHGRTRWGAIGEDQFFTQLLRGVGADVHFEEYMYFDPVLIRPNAGQDALEHQLRSLPAHVDVLHFEGNADDIVDRSNMTRAYKLLFEKDVPTITRAI